MNPPVEQFVAGWPAKHSATPADATKRAGSLRPLRTESGRRSRVNRAGGRRVDGSEAPAVRHAGSAASAVHLPNKLQEVSMFRHKVTAVVAAAALAGA